MNICVENIIKNNIERESMITKEEKEKRKEKHLTQQQLADQIGKERAYIAKIEQGKTDLQLSNFMQIINALGLSLKIG